MIAQPASGLKSVNDRDEDGDGTDDTFAYAYANTTLEPAGPFLAVRFDCTRGDAPTSLPCVVESAADAEGTVLAGVTCTVALTGP